MNNTGVALRFYHEIEYYNKQTGELICGVNISHIKNNDNTTLFLYYNNPTSHPQQTPEKTCNSSFVGVWHMNDKTPSYIVDSTINNHDAYKKTTNAPQEFLGKIGKAQYYQRENEEYIRTPQTISLDITKDMTMDAWINLDYNDAIILWKDLYSPRGYQMGLRNNRLYGYIGYGRVLIA